MAAVCAVVFDAGDKINTQLYLERYEFLPQGDRSGSWLRPELIKPACSLINTCAWPMQPELLHVLALAASAHLPPMQTATADPTNAQLHL